MAVPRPGPPSFFPKKVYLDEKSLDFPLTERVLGNLPGIPREIVSGSRRKQAILESIRNSPDPIGEGKQILYLTVQKGRFVKPCPCTPWAIGCGYFIINLNLQCPLDCTYCILQHYLTEPWLTVFVNLEDLWRELDRFLEKYRRRTIRIGTGELGDSLALDHFTGLSRNLVSYFLGKTNVCFELKTKTTNIRSLPAVKAQDTIVVSWSLNSEPIAAEEERGAPSVLERIAAAAAAVKQGYRVGFHFDPLIRYPSWERDYEDVVRHLFRAVSASSIAWISLGALRFPPTLKKIILSRFPATKIIYDEFILGRDGKLRYFRPLRLELFRHMAGLVRTWGGEEIPLYLCMEGKNIWEDSLKWKPGGRRDVESTLSPRLSRPSKS
jgi:DNA repair photolyase